MFKIIIIEDDREIREELKILLQNSGYEVKVISEFENVEEKILAENAHLVLLDINLPNKSGYEICSKVRAKSKVPIIFVTSRNNSMDELKGIMLGGDDYIEKPYNVPILLASNKEKIVPRADIINYLWDNEVYADDNSLSVIITRLREKLKEIGFLVNYLRKNTYIKSIEKVMDGLQEKYLISEVMEKPKREENLAYYRILKKANKSMLENVTKVQMAR